MTSPWPVYHRLKQAREQQYPELFFTTWKEILLLDTANANPILGNVLLLELVRMAKQLPDRDPVWTAPIVACLEDLRLSLTLDPDDCKWYVAGLRLAMRYREFYPDFDKFVAWWNPDYLQPEDYLPYDTPDGTRIMPLAERLWLAWGKHLLARHDTTLPQIEEFLLKLRILSQAHPEYVWLDYIEAKMLILINEYEKALGLLRKFLTYKSREWWAWSALGYIAQCLELPTQAIACYAMAIRLQKNDAFLVKVRERLAMLWLSSGDPDMAKVEIDSAIATRINSWGKIPDSLHRLSTLKIVTKAQLLSQSVVQKKYLSLIPLARKWSVEGFPTIPGLLLAILRDSKGQSKRTYALVQIEKEQIRKVPASLLLTNMSPYSPLMITVLPDSERWLLIDQLPDHPKSDFVLKVSGRLIRHEKGFGFIDDLYLPHTLMEKLPPDPIKKTIEVFAYWNYHRAKGTWNWRTFEVRIPGQDPIKI